VIILQGVESLVLLVAGFVPGQRLDSERVQLLGLGGHDIVGLLFPSDPAAALDVLRESLNKQSQEVTRILPAQHQAHEIFPTEGHHLSNKICQAMAALDMAEVNPAVVFDLRPDFEEAGLEGGELIGGQLREGTLGHRKRSPF
jgi:hypothetical protein